MRLPWARAPRAAFGSPITVLVAVVTGLVVAFVAAGTTLYVSATGSAAVQYVVNDRCPDDTGAIVTAPRRLAPRVVPGQGPVHPKDPLGPLVEPVRAAAARHGLDVVQRTRYVRSVPITHRGSRLTAQLVSKDGAFDHTRPTSGGGADGAWVPSDLAQWYGLAPGDALTVQLPAGPRELPIAAVYPALTDPLADFWCSERTEVIPLLLIPEGKIKPPSILISPVLLQELGAAGLPTAQQVDRLRVTSSHVATTRSEAQRQAAAVAAFRDDFATTIRPDFEVSDQAAFPAAAGERAQHNARDSLLPLAAVCLLVGLFAVVGLARQWVQRRHAEVRLLFVRGASPAALGVKALLELGLPLVVGCGLGWVAARLAVPTLAPAAELDPWAAGVAAVVAGSCWVLCGVVLGVATALRVRSVFEPRTRRVRLPRWLRPPWELAVLAVAVLSYLRLLDGALVEDASRLLPRVDVVALLFPLLCLAVVLGVAVRLAGLAMRAGHRLRGWRVPAALWALRRAAAQRRLTTALLLVAGFAVGVIAAGVGVSDTVKASIADKGRIFVGSDASIRVFAAESDPVRVPDALRGSATKVASHEPSAGKRVLVVDPATFADGVVWRDEWAGVGLDELLARLGPAGADGTVPVLRVGPAGPDEYRLGDVPPMREVASVPTFPGRGNAESMLVLAVSALPDELPRGFTRYVWTRADPATAVGALEEAGEPTSVVQTAAGANDALPFLMVAWTFDFFVTLGLVLAAIAAATLLVSIEARRRSTALAHGLLGRMGARVRSLFASHVMELAGFAAAAATAGLFGGWLVLTIAGRHLDPSPRLSPSPTAASLWPLTVPVAVVFAVAVVVVAGLAVRSAVRAPIRELLRG